MKYGYMLKMDEPSKYANWKKKVTIEHILYDYMKCPE